MPVTPVRAHRRPGRSGSTGSRTGVPLSPEVGHASSPDGRRIACRRSRYRRQPPRATGSPRRVRRQRFTRAPVDLPRRGRTALLQLASLSRTSGNRVPMRQPRGRSPAWAQQRVLTCDSHPRRSYYGSTHTRVLGKASSGIPWAIPNHERQRQPSASVFRGLRRSVALLATGLVLAAADIHHAIAD